MKRVLCSLSIAVFLGATAEVMANSSISLHSLDAGKVYLLGYGDPEYARALDPGRDVKQDALLPFTPVIKNGSDKTLLAYVVRWTCRNAKGQVSFPEVTIFDFSSFPSTSSVPPGGVRIVSHLRLCAGIRGTCRNC